MFNSVNNIESDNERVQDHQLELLTNEADNETGCKENDFPVNEDMNDDSENMKMIRKHEMKMIQKILQMIEDITN